MGIESGKPEEPKNTNSTTTPPQSNGSRLKLNNTIEEPAHVIFGDIPRGPGFTKKLMEELEASRPAAEKKVKEFFEWLASQHEESRPLSSEERDLLLNQFRQLGAIVSPADNANALKIADQIQKTLQKGETKPADRAEKPKGPPQVG